VRRETPREELARRLVAEPRPVALARLNDVLSWVDEPGSTANVAHMEYNVRLVEAVRLEAERKKVPPPWA
jgi:hypothetical protein